jgi:chlorite dismutase
MVEPGSDPVAEALPSTERAFIQALTLAVDPAWRRLPADDRAADARAFVEAHSRSGERGIRSHAYSLIGLEAGIEILLWRMGPSLEALETSAAELLTSGVGRWASIHDSFLGRIGESQYVRTPSTQEQSLFEGERSQYLIVYPFTKSADWYLLSREARQGVMNEHMRVGHGYPQVRQLLGYSFGIDDHDFLVAYETDDLVAFGDLVRALRATESRRSTVRDTPILLGIHRPLEAILRLLGA